MKLICVAVQAPDECARREWQVRPRWIGIFVLAMVFAVSLVSNGTGFGNPIMRGADPHALVQNGAVWVYPTWGRGGQQFYAFSSTNFQSWERHGPVLDFKDIRWIRDDGKNYHQAWAPSVATKNGRYYFYYSVGPQSETPSRIGVAAGTNPAGPFVDSGKPLLTGGDGFEAIDPMVFTDPKSRKTYFYAGGSAGAKLRVFELNADMVSFAREVPVETPPQFKEGVFMHFREGKYYLSYSHGGWRDASYSVHYALADSPTGPWQYQGAILTSDATRKGPGHHSFIQAPDSGDWLMVYHRWENKTDAGPYTGSRQVCIDRVDYDRAGGIKPVVMTSGTPTSNHWSAISDQLKGAVVIDHSPAASGLYIGSPSLTVWTNGDYLASHDYFGPNSKEFERATSVVFRSSDRGETWKPAARLLGVFWNNLFTHAGSVYLMGTDKHHGHIVIRRSSDGGTTWTEPADASTGLLTPTGEYHTAPMPVVEHHGRLWRAFEDAMGGTKWGERYRAGMLSVPANADLLNATNWVFSNFLARNPEWLDGKFGAWLEGNAVVTREGGIVNMLRVETPDCPEKAAIVNLSADGRTASFDPTTGFIDFPGGAKKFSVRFDEVSSRYWSLATIVPERHQKAGRPGGVRNTLALVCSKDLRTWETRCILLYHPEISKHGFQYPDWRIEGDDIIAVVRTAFDDGQGGARNNHDANFLTFHRWRNFRSLSTADSVNLL